MGYVWKGRWKYRKHKIFLCQRRTLLHIPQSIRTGQLLQKHLMAQEVIIVFDQIMKQNLSYIPCQLMRSLCKQRLFVDIDCLKTGHYVAAVYEGQWYPSFILEINWDQRDQLVKSMHNSGYDKNFFFWPPRDDKYWVPFTHFIGLTEVPNMDKTVKKSVQNCLNHLTKI